MRTCLGILSGVSEQMVWIWKLFQGPALCTFHLNQSYCKLADYTFSDSTIVYVCRLTFNGVSMTSDICLASSRRYVSPVPCVSRVTGSSIPRLRRYDLNRIVCTARKTPCRRKKHTTAKNINQGHQQQHRSIADLD